MIVRLSGKLVEKQDNALTVNVHGIHYEVFVPASVSERVEQTEDSDGNVHLVTYHYLQMNPSGGWPILVGFINEVEKDFFQQFIKVSGIGPKAAVKALNRPISEIAQAIDTGDVKFLTSLPGIGLQRAKEVVAKLQDKVAKFGLIQDHQKVERSSANFTDFQKEALEVLLQLQYKKSEALDMIERALERTSNITTTESLLSEIYRSRESV